EAAAGVGVAHERPGHDRPDVPEAVEIVRIGLVHDERVDQARVAAGDGARRRALREPPQHPVSGALHRTATDERADGYAGYPPLRERVTKLAHGEDRL